jgi:hypothetical protein
MEQKTEHRAKRKAIANFFGGLGYFFCFLQWFWAVALYFSVIQSVILFVAPSAESPVERSPVLAFELPSAVSMIILAITVVVMVIITVYVLVKMPIGIAKTGNKAVHQAAKTVTPVIIKAQHKKDTRRFREKIEAEVMLLIKLSLVVIPVVLAAVSGLLGQQSVSYSIALIVGGGLACLSVAPFIVQYGLAGVFRIKLKDLW